MRGDCTLEMSAWAEKAPSCPGLTSWLERFWAVRMLLSLAPCCCFRAAFFPLIKCFPCPPSAGTLTVEQIYQDRDQFAKLVREVAAPDVGRMGIEILSFTIKVCPGEGHGAGLQPAML